MERFGRVDLSILQVNEPQLWVCRIDTAVKVALDQAILRHPIQQVRGLHRIFRKKRDCLVPGRENLMVCVGAWDDAVSVFGEDF